MAAVIGSTLFNASVSLAWTNLASLASSSTRLAGCTSPALDVSALQVGGVGNPPFDIMLGGALKVGAGSITASLLEILIAASEDGTNYAGGLTASGTPTLVAETKALLIPAWQIANNTTASQVYQLSPISLLRTLGYMPRKFLLFATQSTGQALVAGSAVSYTAENSQGQ